MSRNPGCVGHLAHARSGDKGNRANIGVVCNDANAFAYLDRTLTAEAVAAFLAPMNVGKVTRYALPKIHAFNFVIESALGGGASRSLRLDTQGKALGSILMQMILPDEESVEEARP